LGLGLDLGLSLSIGLDLSLSLGLGLGLSPMLEDHLIPWAREHFDDADWCFQQDSAPGHKANETQERLSEEYPGFISRDEWPSNLPNLNPIDYSVCEYS
jgi:hypothetical protein